MFYYALDSYDQAKDMLPRILRDSDMSSLETPRRKKPRVTPRTLPIPPLTSSVSLDSQSNLEMNSNISQEEPVTSADTTNHHVDFSRQPTFVLVSSEGLPVVNNDQIPPYDHSNYHPEIGVLNNISSPTCATVSCESKCIYLVMA